MNTYKLIFSTKENAVTDAEFSFNSFHLVNKKYETEMSVLTKESLNNLLNLFTTNTPKTESQIRYNNILKFINEKMTDINSSNILLSVEDLAALKAI